MSYDFKTVFAPNKTNVTKSEIKFKTGLGSSIDQSQAVEFVKQKIQFVNTSSTELYAILAGYKKIPTQWNELKKKITKTVQEKELVQAYNEMLTKIIGGKEGVTETVAVREFCYYHRTAALELVQNHPELTNSKCLGFFMSAVDILNLWATAIQSRRDLGMKSKYRKPVSLFCLINYYDVKNEVAAKFYEELVRKELTQMGVEWKLDLKGLNISEAMSKIMKYVKTEIFVFSGINLGNMAL